MKRKILIFIDWYKPGCKAGGPIRSISNVVNQFQNKVDFSIITRNTDYLDNTPYSTIKSNKWNQIDGARVFYLSNDNINKATLKKLILEVKPDIVYCNSLYSPKFTLTPIRIAKKLNIKTILAVRGMLSEGSLSVKTNKKRFFLSIIKGIGLFNKTTFHATNSNEKNDILKKIGNNTNVIIAQNLAEKKNIPFFYKEKEIGELKLISIGRIAPEKNTHFALEVLKTVTKNILFDIYGPIYSDDYWNKCKEIISQLPANIVVNYKGPLEHQKVSRVLKNYHTLFSPSTGENFGHVIIEAMANSCIPLISDKTPWTGLKEKNVGFDISLNNKKEYSKTIDLLAQMDEKSINEMTKNAHTFANEIVNSEKVIEDYYKLFQLNN